MAEENIKMIETQNDAMWFEGSPVAVYAVRLALNVDTGDVFTSAKFVNLYPSVLQTIVFDVICYDAFRKPITRLTNLRFDNVEAERNAPFGYHRKIEVPDISTRNVEYIIRYVGYANGETWENPDDRRFDTRLEQENIYSVQGNYNKQFLDICTRSGINGMNLVLQPVFAPDHWLCACGAFNWADEEKCSQCNVNREWLRKSTDLSLLRQKQEREAEATQKIREQVASYAAQDNREAQKAEFEQRRENYQQEVKQQKRQMTRKMMRIIIAILLILGVGAYILFTFVFPKFGEAEEYQKAEKTLSVSATAPPQEKKLSEAWKA